MAKELRPLTLRFIKYRATGRGKLGKRTVWGFDYGREGEPEPTHRLWLAKDKNLGWAAAIQEISSGERMLITNLRFEQELRSFWFLLTKTKMK